MRPTALTAHQRQILAWIWWRRSANGMAPTIREISRRFGRSSPTGTPLVLDALARKGCLHREKAHGTGVGRTMRPAGWLLVTTDGRLVPMTDHEAQTMLGRINGKQDKD